MTARRRIDDSERRARLVARHHLGRTAATVEDAVGGVVAMHSSDPATPYLGGWARVDGFASDDLDRALCDDRTLCRVHAMRRTLFVVPSAARAAFDAGAGRAVAKRERARLVGWLGPEVGGADRVEAWLARVEAEVLAALEADGPLRTQELSAQVPALSTEVTLGSGKWSTRTSVSSRLLYTLALDGEIVRAASAGSWRSSQYAWAAASRWYRDVAPPLTEADGRREVARRYLASHGPVTRTDLRWWSGWTAKQADAALAGLGAVAVDLAVGHGGDAEGWVLPEDLDPASEAAEDGSVALLPGLDPAPMGWKERAWYLGPVGGASGIGGPLFDTNGNVGPTVWCDGRVIGGFGQRPDGEVVTRLLVDVGADVRARVEAEAARLTAWLDGVVVKPRFRTPLEHELSG